mmetsp:Transcript_11955/g.22154  ORF Transcript_11955/g.22154 Transcript_11955/m.22154 type:complete len:82 (+) Transcript_11955:1395-1640(+)
MWKRLWYYQQQHDLAHQESCQQRQWQPSLFTPSHTDERIQKASISQAESSIMAGKLFPRNSANESRNTHLYSQLTSPASVI